MRAKIKVMSNFLATLFWTVKPLLAFSLKQYVVLQVVNSRTGPTSKHKFHVVAN